jgi:hypothetical protein
MDGTTADWRIAFLLQAKAEYDVLVGLSSKKSLPWSHTLHYVQMVSEKMAKGMNCTGQKPPRDHKALVNFIRAAKSMSALSRTFGFGNQRQFRAYLDGLLPIARAIESLAPRGDRELPNPEYPWEISANEIAVPSRYGFPGLNSGDSDMAKFMKFLDFCFRYITTYELPS